MTNPSQTTKSAEKVLEVLTVLLGHFAHGLTPGELARATDLSPSNITRYVATLEEKGFAGEFDLQRRAEEVPVAEYVALAQGCS